MGNVSGREDGEGGSGAKKNGNEVDNEQFNSDPMLHSPPHSPNESYQLPFLLPPQVSSLFFFSLPCLVGLNWRVE